MTCCSTCVSGFAAAVALIAFIFDLVLFFVAKARINSVGTASMGTAIWLTLAAWLLLFFSGCLYTVGRCCISKRKPRDQWGRRQDRENGEYDQMRLDAVKAEADRKAMQGKEVGLSPLPEAQPLTARVDGDNVIIERPYRDQSIPNTANNLQSGGYGGRPAQGGGYVGGGYVQAPAGSRAVDEYYNPTQSTSYPPQPQPRRQGSATTGYAPSTYAASTYTYAAPEPSSPTHNLPVNNQYLSTNPQQYPDRHDSPVGGYGHTAGGTTCKF